MMKRLLLLVLISIFGLKTFGQNKTLGVGVASPNPNAALHVESPTNNQGAMMPRLTTAQRNAMTGILGTADAGLLLYDNDLKALYIWNGSAWESSAKIHYPLVDTLLTLPPNGNALRLVYTGTDVGNFGVAHFENLNPNAGFSAIFGRTNSTTNGAADLVVNNPANTNDALGVTTNALTGRAGSFLLNNAGSRNHSLYAQTNGDSTGSAIHGNNIGNGFGVYGKSAGSKFASAAVYGEHVGTGDAAGAFRITNAANTYSALYGETNGSGPALFANNIGSGRAGQVQINNPTNSSAALRAFTNGTGNAGFFTISNVSNDSSALYITSSGTGNAITANRPIKATRFIGDGSGLTNLPAVSFPFSTSLSNASTLFDITNTGAGKAGNFTINNPSNADNTLRVTTNGTGDNGWFEVTNAASTGSPVVGITNGIGVAGFFQVNNAASGTTAIQGITNSNVGGATPPVAILGTSTGTGASAGSFRINNATNPYTAFYAETNGTGYAVMGKQTNATSGNAAYFEISNAGNPGSALYAKTYGTGNAVGGLTTGTGTAARFEISNSGNTGSAIEAVTDGTGSAVQINQTNGGFAIELLGGGVKISSAIYAAPVTIVAKAALYEISSGSGNVDLPSSGPVGETCWVANSSGGDITVNTVKTVVDGTVRQFIRLTGGWQIIN